MKTVFNFDKKVREQSLGVIKHLAFKAAQLRLAGEIARAKVREDTIDQLVTIAEVEGWGNDAFEAESEGQELAQQARAA